MQISLVTVMPIGKNLFKERLSYFSVEDLPLGSVVNVPIRGRSIPALVILVESAEDSKAKIRAASFAIKKIENGKPRQLFSSAFIGAVDEAAEYFAAPAGAIIEVFSPKAILEESATASEIISVPKKDHPVTAEQFVFQSDEEERLVAYRSLFREEFARGFSLFLCLPTIEDVERYTSLLAKGIEGYVVTLHSELSKKEMVNRWQRIASDTHPLLIIGTSTFLSVPRNDISTFIVEKESSSAYRRIGRPHIDARTFTEFLAKKSGARLIFGDTILRAETLYRHDEHEFPEWRPVKLRLRAQAETVIVDMKKEVENAVAKKTYPIISERLIAEIAETIRRNGNIFVFAGRRGLAPVTVCEDCGETLMCGHCTSPMVLHEEGSGRFYLCHQCGKKIILGKQTEDLCRSCGSWRMKPLGIGSGRIESELEKKFPRLNIVRLDSDVAKTRKSVTKAIKEFYGSKATLLIGTELALPYLTEEIDCVAAVGIDSLFTIPDFRIEERVFQMLSYLKTRTRRIFIIQTRDKDRELLSDVSKGDLVGFYRRELAERKQFGYPPFAKLLKITYRGKREEAEREMARLHNYLRVDPFPIFPAFIPEVKKEYRLHGLLSFEPKQWPRKELVERLKSLPLQFDIEVDPETIL